MPRFGEESAPGSGPSRNLSSLTTDESIFQDRGRLAVRYARPIHDYLKVLLKDEEAANEVAQAFLAKVLENGISNPDSSKGRFRDYLKAAVRNAAYEHLRRRRSRKQVPLTDADMPATEDPLPTDDEKWLAGIRSCLADAAWRALDAHERRDRGARANQFHTVLRLSVDHPEADSATLAQQVSQRTGKPMSAEAFRKQLSRARSFFGQVLVREVAATLFRPTLEAVEEELAGLGLLQFVRDYLQELRSAVPPPPPPGPA